MVGTDQKGIPVGRMKLAALTAVVLVLSGCAPDADHDLKRLALPVAGSDRTAADSPQWCDR